MAPPGSFREEIMEDQRRRKSRTLQRLCVCSRLEEQLWALAYQQLGLGIGRPAGRLPEPARKRARPRAPTSSSIAHGA